jgi:hypothetical protein
MFTFSSELKFRALPLATGRRLQASGYRLQATGCRLQVAGYGLNALGCRRMADGCFINYVLNDYCIPFIY